MCVNCDDNSESIPSGIQGETGPQGLFGGFCGEWNFSTSTASGPPATYLRFNNAAYTAVNSILVADSNADNINYSAFLASFDNGGNFGLVKVFCKTNSTIFWMGEVLAVTDNGTDYSIDVSYILHNGTFTADMDVVICFTPSGIDPVPNQQRLNTIFRQSDTPYATITSSTLADAAYMVYDRTGFGDVLRCRVVLKGTVNSQAYKIKVTDEAGTVLWNVSTTLPADTNIHAVDLGAPLTTPVSTGITYLRIEYASDNTNPIRLYSIDFYNE